MRESKLFTEAAQRYATAYDAQYTAKDIHKSLYTL